MFVFFTRIQPPQQPNLDLYQIKTQRQLSAVAKIFTVSNSEKLLAAYPFSLRATLQQVSWLVVLQVADAGIGSSVQQQLQDLLLVLVAMKTRRHV